MLNRCIVCVTSQKPNREHPLFSIKSTIACIKLDKLNDDYDYTAECFLWISKLISVSNAMIQQILRDFNDVNSINSRRLKSIFRHQFNGRQLTNYANWRVSRWNHCTERTRTAETKAKWITLQFGLLLDVLFSGWTPARLVAKRP